MLVNGSPLRGVLHFSEFVDAACIYDQRVHAARGVHTAHPGRLETV